VRYAQHERPPGRGGARPRGGGRDGDCMGGGAAGLVLEAEELAGARGAPIRAEILGYGATADAFHLTSPDPSGKHAARAIAVALDAHAEPVW